MAATRKSWKTTPLPTVRKQLTLDRTYTTAELARLREGRVPEEMEDHWFMFFEEPWFFVHRSWTGFCIYAVRFEIRGDSGAQVAEVQVNRDARQYGGTDDVEDSLLLAVLLDEIVGRATGATWKAYLTHPHESLLR